MKIKPKINQLPLFTLVCGGLGALLRLWLYGTGLDSDGLLVANHPAGILVLVLSAAMVGVMLWLLQDYSCLKKYTQQFPPSAWGAAGAFAAAAGVLINAMAELARREVPMPPLVGLLGIAAAAALAFTGLCRLKGLRPTFLFHTLICLNFVVRLISHYQIWCADPQLQDYCFQLLGTVCAMLFAYHRAALDMKGGNRRTLVIMGLLGSYCCCLSVVASDAPTLYAGLAAWMITNLGTLASATEESAEGN